MLSVFFCRAKKELHGNLAVAQTWSEFNALLDKNKVCAKDFLKSESSEVKTKIVFFDFHSFIFQQNSCFISDHPGAVLW